MLKRRSCRCFGSRTLGPCSYTRKCVTQQKSMELHVIAMCSRKICEGFGNGIDSMPV